jgi:hypothetical protein
VNNAYVTWTAGTNFTPVALPAGGQPYSMNDQYCIVGAFDPASPASYDVNGFPLGFFYDGQTVVSFADMIPQTYRKAIRGAIPTQITNPDGRGVVRVHFYGESLEGPHPGTWQAGTFLLERFSDGRTSVTAVQFTQPEGTQMTDVNGSSAGVGIGFLPNTLPRGEVTPKIEFLPQQLVGGDNFISGFDPPMRRDENVAPGELDESETAIWWTSLGRSNPAGVTDINYKKNEFLKIVFPDDATAKMYCLAVRDNTTQLTITPKVFSQAETNLVIEAAAAAAGNDDVTDVTIELRRDTDPANPQPQPDLTGAATATLKVKLMPVWNIPLRVRYVEDLPGSPGTTLPAAVPNPGTIAAWCNRAFRQACVRFTALEPSSTTRSNVDYDRFGKDPGSAPDGALHAIVESDPELQALMAPPGLYDGKQNLVIVHQRSSSIGFDFTYSGASLVNTALWKNRSVILTRPFAPPNGPFFDEGFLYCCAHELGHALGLAHRGLQPAQRVPNDLQNANWPPWARPSGTHDLGFFPVRHWRRAEGHFVVVS